MISKLRLKFIAISTAAVLLVICTLVGLVNSVMYTRTLDDVYQITERLAENGGTMPENGKKIKPNFSDDDAYRIRFFTVRLDSNNNVTSSDFDKIAAIDEDDLEAFVSEALSNRGDKGHMSYSDSEYAYKISSTSDGKMIVFLDCTNEMQTAEDFREMSFLLGLVCLIVFIIIVSIMSKKAIEPVIRNIESQKQFITNASHELKTPLAVISANTEVIEMTNGESEWTRSTINQIDRMNTLIAELITISKFGEKDKKELVEVDCSSIVKTCTNDFLAVFQQQGKQFAFDVSENVKVKAADEGIRQITNILLDNAAKYCDDGGSVKLKLEPKSANKGMKLTVSNTYKDGKNIDVNRFFDRFYREDQSHNSQKSGYGIGLAMAQGYSEEFGGRISVSYKGDTITFTVII
ncbi:MAG: HAMP domain-containing histidine kinase [Eubacterium sp.]|nr:HAMP domain-containing histidine kinase [Eubacterium sp.]